MPVPAGTSQNPIDYIQTLKTKCDRQACNAAVVDLLGFNRANGRPITEQTHPYFRYEVRSLAHIKSYGFKVIYTNYGEEDGGLKQQ